MTALEKRIQKRILEAAEGDLSLVTPSLQVVAYANGKKKIDVQFGKFYRYYDLASLTKVLFSQTQCLSLYDQKKLSPQDRVADFLSWWPHPKTTVHELLTHSARIPNWAPFYKMLSLKKPESTRREELRAILSQIKLSKDKKSVYSDVDIILLGFLFEEIYGMSLIDIFSTWKQRDYFSSLHFCEHNQPVYQRALYAPTEKCPWRKKVLQGEVHDDNTWSFGGVSSHAGMFGEITDVAKWGLELRKGLSNSSGSRLGQHKTIKLFTKRAVPKKIGDWALGMMMPTRVAAKPNDEPRGASSAGKYLDVTSVGHTGFTGTSIWFDPKNDLLVVALANRVHPTRENAKYVSLRPEIHNIIFEELMN